MASNALAVLLHRPPWLGGRRPTAGGGPPRTVTFPQVPLNTRVQLALTPDPARPPNEWGWIDITEFVRYDMGISLTVGRRDESAGVAPSTATMKLDNRDGRFTRRNPNSPYYGLLTKGTPIWVTVDAGSGEKTRIEMFVNEWPTRWSDMSATDSTVTIQCAGILRRLQQGNVLKSPLRRTILGTSPVAYWPLEDGQTATSGGPAIAGGALMTTEGTVEFAGAVDLAGAEQAADLTNGLLRGNVAGASSTSWHLEYAFKHAAFRVSSNLIVHTSTGQRYIFFPPRFVGDLWVVTSVDTAGTTTAAIIGSTAATAAFVGTWHHVAFTAEQVGANVVSTLTVDGVLEGTDSTAYTLGAPILVRANPNYAYVIDVGIGVFMGHIAVGNGTVVSNGAAALDGYAGEQAVARMRRLCAEEGVTFECLGE